MGIEELLRRARFLLRGRRYERELREEMLLHRDLRARHLVSQGIDPDEARATAARLFGNETLIKEQAGDMWRWTSIESFLRDVRYGIRQLRRNPGFAAVAVLTLALGIGANTAIFSVVDSVLLRPLPFKDPGRLVRMFETERAPGNYPLTGADYLDWQAQNRTLEATTLFSGWKRMSAGGAAEPESVTVVNTQANFFNVLGVRPYAGRTFMAGEDAGGKNRVAILSYGFWERRFGGSAKALSDKLTFDDEPYIVIGVMPRWFNFPAGTDVWTPLDMSPEQLGPRDTHHLNALARLKPGVALAAARGDLLAISKRLEKQYPGSNDNVHAVLIPLKDTLIGEYRAPLLILFGAVVLVLLVACANVANLQLARASARHREMAVRTSLGAGRLRLIRQLLTESILLAIMGAAFGTLAAWWCVRLLESAKNIPIPRANPVQIDGTVLLFTLALSIAAGVLFGLAPAFQNSGLNVSEALKASAQAVLNPAGARGTLRDALIISEIALTLALLVGAGLLLRSFAHLRNTAVGINPRNVLTMSVDLPKAKYATLPARRRFFEDLIDRVEHTPGVAAAAVSTEIPLEGGNNGYLKADGERDPRLSSQLVGWNYITPDYFRTLGIPLIEGRIFTPEDLDRTAAVSTQLYDLYKAESEGPPNIPGDMTLVSIISQKTATTFWHNQDPVGRSFHWNNVKVTVIGVVGDVKEYGVRAGQMPQAYFPFTLALAGGGYGHLTLKARVPPLNLLSAIRKDVHQLDSGLAVFRARKMDDVIAGDTQDASFQAFLLGSFATLALLLAAVGLYGVMSYLVTQRTREIGIRMALGAKQSDVLRLILKQGTKLVLAGLIIGALAALALTRLMSSLLYGVAPTDPLTFVGVAILLAVVSLAAYYLPARRAAGIDPVQALRHE